MPLTHWKRALVLGLLSWLLPFALSVVVFPLKRANAPLFEAIMAVVVIVAAALLGRLYFRPACSPSMVEAALLGVLWLAVNVVLDYPLFAYGPMRMTAARYYSEIGAGYLLYPAFLAGVAWVSGKQPRTT